MAQETICTVFSIIDPDTLETYYISDKDVAREMVAEIDVAQVKMRSHTLHHTRESILDKRAQTLRRSALQKLTGAEKTAMGFIQDA